MIGRLFRRAARSAAIPPVRIPEGRRVYAIGDVHGCLDLFDRLLALIDADNAARAPADTSLILLGDLVDRGPQSAQVVARARHLQAFSPDVRVLAGNHEELLLRALDGEREALRLFARVGGRETALSYGIGAADYDAADYDALAKLLQAAIPAEDRRFLAAAEDMVVIGDYAFVHAGVRPGVPLDDQRQSDLRWIRGEFLSHARPLEKMIVHGHTISEEVVVTPTRIGLDTGAYASGTLSAMGFEAGERWVIQAELPS
ncbi:serine/threonine protein phosphatase 1 [Sphingomonas guangdongensis]|uniref:Serine/threonine protein phosphatase 1 n=1 Tax=Sphingomonas guangdongensis TaxID=1141890 RepID=A0A285QXM6_9SPHN|nr:metallophosphoesterase family protein [Sphingomonas guangdongensis]SOB86591.1 serine/threonine protein phosphatase 1 [Sphingomonas guangdongensis]